MLNFLRRSACLVVLLHLFQTTALASPSFSISLNTIANLHLTRHTTVADLYTVFGKENVKLRYTQPEGSPVPSVAIYIDGRLAIEGLIEEMNTSAKLQNGLMVTDGRFVTDRGIKTGSTVGELKNSYPIDEVYTGEAGVKYAISRAAQLTFRLKELRFGTIKAGNISEVPDNIAIDGIYVWPHEKY